MQPETYTTPTTPTYDPRYAAQWDTPTTYLPTAVAAARPARVATPPGDQRRSTRRLVTALLAVLLVSALVGLTLAQGAAPFAALLTRGQTAQSLQGIERANANASAALSYRPGYSVQGSWLCYGWASGAYRCTQHWYRASSGALISTNTAWVPNGLASGGAAGVAGGPMTLAYTARPANSYPWGQCTWGAMALARDNVSGLGNAGAWLANAQRRGMATGSTPRVGATVVYQPYVQGASWLGHVAHVVRVNANGSFLVEEMNYVGYGGGFGRFSYRTSWTGWGVAFIY